MKKTLLIALGLILGTAGVYNHTHSNEYVSAAYDRIITQECGNDRVCLFGGALARNSTIACMKDQFLSTSPKTLEKCLDRLLNGNNK